MTLSQLDKANQFRALHEAPNAFVSRTYGMAARHE